VAGLTERLRAAEARVAELDAALIAAVAESSHGSAGHGSLASDEDAAPGAGAASLAEAVTAEQVTAVEAHPVPAEPGEDPNSWEQRRRRAAEALIPWIEQTVPLAGRTVLEYGCGNAPVSCAFAQRGARVIGVDIDRDGLALGRRELAARGIDSVELELHPPETIRDAVAARRGQIDVFLLYAVLEHLEIGERLAVLRLAREVIKPDGVIIVCESPNRLIYFDHHTAQMPFFHLLEPELALRYRHRSGREVITGALDDAAVIGHDAALARLAALGRGVSYHEFELVFEDLPAHIVASNYDPLLFGERPIHPDEVILSRYLARWRPDLAPVWSRYWLDLILTPQPGTRRPPQLRPWTADTTESVGVGWTAWENLHFTGPQSTLWINLPRPTTRLVVGTITQDGRWLTMQARPQPGRPLIARHRAPAGVNAFSTFTLEAPASRIGLGVSDACHAVFIGYEE
jgi:2-polyprenyl-3-methyl-5-hydroxy-6-metoxy-1,4-benzoquinol methylase